MGDLELVKNTFGNLLKLMKIDKNGFSSRKRNRITLKEKKLVNLIFRNCKKTGQAFFGDCFFQIYYSMFASSHRDRRGNLGEIKNWQNFAALWLY